jgi:WD40 repeat protein
MGFAEWFTTKNPHRTYDWVCSVAITPNGRRVVSASLDETLKIWDLQSGKELKTLTEHSDSVHAVAISL